MTNASSPSLPLLAEWSGPHGGAPAFNGVRVADFAPAILAAIEANRREIAAILQDPAPASFANTLAALEDAGRPLSRVSAIFSVFASTMNDAAMREVEQAMAPVFAAFADEVVQNSALFARVKAVYEAGADLTAEQRRLALVTWRRFARHGAALEDSGKARMAEINQRLASLSTRFSQNVLADEETHVLTLGSADDLAGLPPSIIAGAAAAAAGRAEGWRITNTRSSVEPFLTYSDRRDLREKAWRMWTTRGEAEGPHDNRPIITEILRLRAEKARLLGFPTFAHWICEDQMAKTPDAAMDLMLAVWPAAKAQVAEDVAAMRKVAGRESAGTPIAPWDYRYLAEKVRKDRFDLDENAVKPYLQLEKLREAMFWVAGQLYGLAFAPVGDLAVYEPTVRVFEVTRGGARVGLFYFDPYARSGKSSGAWMSEYRSQERFAGVVTPIVSNNANFVPPAPGEPVLVSWQDAVTLFHEFGHGLHGLNSNVAYPSLSGTNVARDFVELPSQLHERWLPTSEVLGRFCRHVTTGEPMPASLIERLGRARVFNKGFDTVEYLACAIVDMKAHLAGEASIDPSEFEARILAEIGMPPEIVMRHRLPHFSHIFAGEAYAAGYYDYIWADALTADVAEAFSAAPGGFYDRPTARRLHDEIMSVGDTVDADVAFRRFRGRDVDTSALMRDRGFA